MYNNRGPADVRNIFSGKDGLFFDENGIMLATVDNFTTQVNVTNAKYQPLGDTQEHEHVTGYGVTLTISQCLIEDDRFFQDLANFWHVGQPLMWTFQGVLKGRNGSEQRMIYRDCVPSGQIDLQNFSVGDIIKRQWSLFVNCPPELQNLLTYARNERY